MEINHLSVIGAALAAFGIGALWYSPVLFANAWMKACGFTEKDLEGANMGAIFGGFFVCAIIMSYCLAHFIGRPEIDVTMGAVYGALTGAGWITPAIVVNGLFERRPWTYAAIHGGYWTVSFTVMGVILRYWP